MDVQFRLWDAEDAMVGRSCLARLIRDDIRREFEDEKGVSVEEIVIGRFADLVELLANKGVISVEEISNNLIAKTYGVEPYTGR